ncbi:hypothetical protein ACFS5N_05690 [Mucilaginibacter ximonensis]|uniref:Uncharacterized protein n=1 Tax=Mucilaginibacter ximonensis TaxID=538021 RepID=A0ABW5Y9I4_9SPHI
MSYIMIETHGGAEYAIIVTNENGENKVFANLQDAEAEADDCQEGMVIEL